MRGKVFKFLKVIKDFRNESDEKDGDGVWGMEDFD